MNSSQLLSIFIKEHLKSSILFTKGSTLLHMYLPNWHANVVKYDDFSSSFKL